jgi:hypothetical protein
VYVSHLSVCISNRILFNNFVYSIHMQKIHLIACLKQGFIYLIILYNTTKRKNPLSRCERGGKGQEVIMVVPFPLVTPCRCSVAPAPHRRRSSPSSWCQSSPLSWYPLVPFACLSSGYRLPARLPATLPPSRCSPFPPRGQLLTAVDGGAAAVVSGGGGGLSSSSLSSLLSSLGPLIVF